MLQEITVHYFSQEDLLQAGCFDIKMAVEMFHLVHRSYLIPKWPRIGN